MHLPTRVGATELCYGPPNRPDGRLESFKQPPRDGKKELVGGWEEAGEEEIARDIGSGMKSISAAEDFDCRCES